MDELTGDGVDLIKPEYIIKDHVRVLSLECVSESDKRKLDSEDAPDGCKRPKEDSGNYKKLKGQNKARRKFFNEGCLSNFCPNVVDSLADENKACPVPGCKFEHDFKLYLEKKPPDIGETCYVFSIKGRCPRGVTCRYGTHHLTPDGFNIVNKDLYDKCKGNKLESTSNALNKEVQFQLRKKKYDFGKTENVLKEYDSKKENPCDVIDVAKVRPQEKNKIDWGDKLYLSPLTTVGNLPFRRICKEYGADITCGEMAMAKSILQGSPAEWALVKRHSSEGLFGVQLCGNNPYIMTKCAQVLEETCDLDFIDINLGCPIELVFDEGGGSALLRREKVLKAIVTCMNNVLSIPLTVKTRTGVSSNKSTAHNLMPMFRDAGVSLVTVHGRSREQRYTKKADWQYIEQCAKADEPTPVFGNGDILSYNDYLKAREDCPTIKGVMIGRGALIKPWIFTEIKERRHLDPSSSERFEILKKYVNYGLQHWGSDTRGVENTRKFLLEWLSFLYRYIPTGLLVNPPLQVNQRPPVYKGRDDLETLMASPNCKDWIKISEMLLGPVPDGFNFLPKHKANAWK